MEFTYKYVAQSGVYGSDTYGSQEYSCAANDTACLTTQAPNTGFFTAQNTPAIIGGFVAVALIATVITYVILRKLKKQKA